MSTHSHARLSRSTARGAKHRGHVPNHTTASVRKADASPRTTSELPRQNARDGWFIVVLSIMLALGIFLIAGIFLVILGGYY